MSFKENNKSKSMPCSKDCLVCTFASNEIDEVIRIAENWNNSIKEKSSCVPQTIIDRLKSVRNAKQ